VATWTFAVELTEIVAGTVVAPTQVATPAVAVTLLIGAFTVSDDTQVKYCGLVTGSGSAQPSAGAVTKPTLNAC
jgi:hypothetical protein